MKIRPLRHSDVRVASRLYRETVRRLKRYYTAKELNRELKAYSAKGLQALMEKRSLLFRVAEDKGRIVGVIECYFPVPGLCWIGQAIVKESYRSRGVGSMLVRSLEKPIPGKWGRIRTRSRMSNRPSITLFKKLGYTKVATLRRRVRKRSAYAWEKILK